MVIKHIKDIKAIWTINSPTQLVSIKPIRPTTFLRHNSLSQHSKRFPLHQLSLVSNQSIFKVIVILATLLQWSILKINIKSLYLNIIGQGLLKLRLSLNLIGGCHNSCNGSRGYGYLGYSRLWSNWVTDKNNYLWEKDFSFLYR